MNSRDQASLSLAQSSLQRPLEGKRGSGHPLVKHRLQRRLLTQSLAPTQTSKLRQPEGLVHGTGLSKAVERELRQATGVIHCVSLRPRQLSAMIWLQEK